MAKKNRLAKQMRLRRTSSLSSLGYRLGKLLEERERRKQQEANNKLEKAIRELGLTPVCKHCNSSSSMKLISWKDKETGLPKRAYKCLACDKWYYPEAEHK